MFKHSIFIALAIIITAAVLTVACAPAAPSKPAATTPPATSTPPASTTTTPPVTPPPAVKVSFAPKTYTNTEWGFSVMYPDDWKDLKFREPTIFYVGSSMQVPVMSISIYDSASYKSQIENQLTERSKATNFQWSDPTPVTLADGKTKAVYLTMSDEIPGVPLKALWLIVDRPNGKSVCFAWTTITQTFDLDTFKEMMNTVSFK